MTILKSNNEDFLNELSNFTSLLEVFLIKNKINLICLIKSFYLVFSFIFILKESV